MKTDSGKKKTVKSGESAKSDAAGRSVAPVERHSTAAWRESANAKPVSRVPLPTDGGVRNAKEWVDTNEK